MLSLNLSTQLQEGNYWWPLDAGPMAINIDRPKNRSYLISIFRHLRSRIKFCFQCSLATHLASYVLAMLHLRFYITIVLSLAASSISQYQWPSPQYDALEGLLYEGRRSDGSSLASIVNPCRYRSDTNASIAAEWLRFVSTHLSQDCQYNISLCRLFTTQLLMKRLLGAAVWMAQLHTNSTDRRCV